MKRFSKKKIEELLGYRPNRELMIHLLKMVKEEGITIQEAVSRQVLPKIAILDSEGKFWDVRLNKRITPEEWYYENPLGKYGKLVVLKGAENERKSFNK